MFVARHARLGLQEPVRVLVLTFNRTLAGYVKTLAETQISPGANVRLEIDTFGRWAMSALAFPNVPTRRVRNKLRQLAGVIPELSADYVVKEVDYLLGRFEPENLEAYIAAERTGRGAMPRVDRTVRRRLLDAVVYPYLAWLNDEEIADWNTVAVRMARDVDPIGYDVVIVDESQDFSARLRTH